MPDDYSLGVVFLRCSVSFVLRDVKTEHRLITKLRMTTTMSWSSFTIPIGTEVELHSPALVPMVTGSLRSCNLVSSPDHPSTVCLDLRRSSFLSL